MTWVYIGMDDTDNLESRGTGRLARWIAASLESEFTITGVTRHQLLVDPRVPYTSHNSSATISLETRESPDLEEVFEAVRFLMLSDFQPGSDPGLCVATHAQALKFSEFGRRAQREVVAQAEARTLAKSEGVRLEGLGGSEDGVIGALAAVGLAASGEDGRYLLVGRSRDLTGLQPAPAVLAAGVAELRTLDGQPVQDGLVLSDKIRPARRGNRPVLYVEWTGEHWLPVKLD